MPLHTIFLSSFHPPTRDTVMPMDNDVPLKTGWTTGACAAAAAKAAYWALLRGEFPDPVMIRLPKGQTPSFDLTDQERSETWARAAVVKDAGDDPDVTHGATIVAAVRLMPEGNGVTYRAGDGVGTVTLPGLPLPPGEPAINPGPRAMIEEAIRSVATVFGTPGDVEVTVAIPGGQDLARQTMNGRLGIEGGLSVLGTTGVVQPYSCSAWIHGIHRGIDVALAAGIDHLIAPTGSTSEAAARSLLNPPEQAVIDMGDFIGGTLKYLRAHPVRQLTLVGGFAKIAKLSQGHLNVHSSAAELDIGHLTESLASLGANDTILDAARVCRTGLGVLELALEADLPLGDRIARRAREVAMATLAGDTGVTVWVFDRTGQRVGQTDVP